jgi:hypothetical protein
VIVNPGINAGYGEVTSSHLIASATALRELAALASGKIDSEGSAQRVRLGLFDHQSWLNHLLFGFAPFLASGAVVPGRQEPEMPTPPLTHTIHVPTDTAEVPLTYAIVANHPVAVQLEHTITFLARLVARRTITPEALQDGEISHADLTGAALDASADTEVKDLLRSRGWRAAAETICARASGDGLPLAVEFDPELLTAKQLGLQAPILRRVYNQSPLAKNAVDMLVTLMSQGLHTAGGGNAEVARFAQDFLDLGLSRRYLAHLVRDSLVCGNGYLSYGNMPDEDTRLLLPENVVIAGDADFIELSPSGELRHHNVLHSKGATQPESFYGLSILEPLIVLQVQKEQALHWIDRAYRWGTRGVPARHLSWARELIPLAERTLATVEDQTRDILGPVLTKNMSKVKVPEDLYFKGAELMRPAAEAISMDI